VLFHDTVPNASGAATRRLPHLPAGTCGARRLLALVRHHTRHRQRHVDRKRSAAPFGIARWVIGSVPAFNPPSGIFAPVWTLLYALMGVALSLTWRRRPLDARAAPALRLFTLQLLLNALWSVIFFGLKSPRSAFIEIVVLWAAIILTIRAMYRVSRLGAVLLLPYLLWVSFAGLLNLAIWRLND
jgi:tryptophan-rich sensory protein